MNTRRVRDAMEALLAANPEVADRDELADQVRTVRELRTWLDAYEVRCTRRGRELAAEGRAEPAESLLANHGGRSSKDAAAAAERERVAGQATSFEDALADAEVSAGHLDALATATRHLDESQMAAVLATIRHADRNAGTSWQRLQVDAFVAAVGAGPGADRVPEIGILTDYRTLVEGLHAHSVCETVDGAPLPVSTVRRLCCDAEVYPAVLGSNGEILDVGRSERTANRAQRRALRAMHRTCAHPDGTVHHTGSTIDRAPNGLGPTPVRSG